MIVRLMTSHVEMECAYSQRSRYVRKLSKQANSLYGAKING